MISGSIWTFEAAGTVHRGPAHGCIHWINTYICAFGLCIQRFSIFQICSLRRHARTKQILLSVRRVMMPVRLEITYTSSSLLESAVENN